MKNTSINWCIENCVAFEMSDDAKKEMVEIVAFIDETTACIDKIEDDFIASVLRNNAQAARIAELEAALENIIAKFDHETYANVKAAILDASKLMKK